MKVIKRDGRVVDFDRQKIAIAIEKANKEVRQSERAGKEDISRIIEYIEEFGKKRILVEDIQDIIEQKLMEFKKFELAKKYIVYRYTRALVRKQNTTDETILGIIRNINRAGQNSNRNILLVSTQRDLIAGEVSKDLTKRMLLPEKISKAQEEGILYFHDDDNFLHPMINSSLINIEDMLNNGTVINGKLIETPHTFQTACIILGQIITYLADSQYGAQSININSLGKFLRKTYEKFKNDLSVEYKNNLKEEIIENIANTLLKNELRQGVQTIEYQINNLNAVDEKPCMVTLFLHLDSKDEYIKENAMIIEEILKQRYKGAKNEKEDLIISEYPKLVYVLDEHNSLKGGKYDYLTRLAIKCSEKGAKINYLSAKKMRENYEGNIFCPMGGSNFLCLWKDENGKYKFEGRFNQGVVSINLPQIGIIADGDEAKFWKILDERLELCKEALMCRHYALLGTNAEVSPVHWRYGALARLNPEEKIDKLLKNGYSTLSLGYIGIYETTKLMTGVSHVAKEGREFAMKLMKRLKETIEKWQKETSLGFILYGTPTKSLSNNFARIDKEKFGTIEDITDKGYYTNSYHVDEREKIDLFTRLLLENDFQKISLGGGISYVQIPKNEGNNKNETNSSNSIEEIIKFIYDNVQYVQI